MTTAYSFLFWWRGRAHQCQLFKQTGVEQLLLVFDDPEISTLIGRELVLTNNDGRMALPETMDPEDVTLTASILSAIEEQLRKPLAWMVK
jgi:hypothetical protein